MGFGVVVILILALSKVGSSKDIDYNEALSKAIIFYECQRSGKLPPNQTIKWRSDSGLKDGSAANVDLVGGYYDAGDNVKFGLPMAFTTAVLSWSVLEFGNRVPSEQNAATEAVRWATDYLLKACSELPNALYVQVGNPWSDHKCWERPEDMDTPRDVYKVSPSNPGSDVAGETAAALAAASLVFRRSNPEYSNKLLSTAKAAFTFADKYKGKYTDSLSHVVCPFYCSYSGFQDELLWGAAWLYKATGESSYLDYAKSVANEDDSDVFSWDNKLAGSRVLLSSYSFATNRSHGADTEKFKVKAERYICSVLPNSPSMTVKYTPGGLMYKMEGSNLQYVTTSTFLLTVYAKYLEAAKSSFSCGSLQVTPALLRQHVKKQVDYILGDNPKGMSYMVGFGNSFPQKIHHRGSSLPSLQMKPETIGCDSSFQFLHAGSPNPNILTGAVVGGPDQSDNFADDRNSYAQAEPTTYINAPLVGALFDLAATNTVN